MTPEEKAIELIAAFREHAESNGGDDETESYHAKRCALICVDQILSTTYMNVNQYWQLVKQALEKL